MRLYYDLDRDILTGQPLSNRKVSSLTLKGETQMDVSFLSAGRVALVQPEGMSWGFKQTSTDTALLAYTVTTNPASSLDSSYPLLIETRTDLVSSALTAESLRGVSEFRFVLDPLDIRSATIPTYIFRPVVGDDQAPIPSTEYLYPTASALNSTLSSLEADVAQLSSDLSNISLEWSAIGGKPETFPPSEHTHEYTSLQNIPATFTPTIHDVDSQYDHASVLVAPAQLNNLYQLFVTGTLNGFASYGTEIENELTITLSYNGSIWVLTAHDLVTDIVYGWESFYSANLYYPIGTTWLCTTNNALDDVVVSGVALGTTQSFVMTPRADGIADDLQPASPATILSRLGGASETHTHPVSAISDSGAAGQAILQAPTQAAAQLAMGLSPTEVRIYTVGAFGGVGDDPSEYQNIYTVDVEADWVMVAATIIGAGGGGGSGRRGATGTIRCGGGGGGGGGVVVVPPQDVSNWTNPFYVGAGWGGAGGLAQTSDSTNGQVGQAGVESYIVTSTLYYTGRGGAGGGGGSATAGTGGAAKTNAIVPGLFLPPSNSHPGGAASTTGGVGGKPADTTTIIPCGGGAGGGISSGNARALGGGSVLVGATGSLYETSPACDGTTYIGGAGGSFHTFRIGMGGAGSGPTAGFVGQAGGAGGPYGGGGGGGSASLNGNDSGAGGRGGHGAVILYIWKK